MPRHLLNWIARDPAGVQARSEFLQGSVLFADVSGFTAMSEKLQALGREGAEEITLLVNNYFETMLEIGDHYGGDLLKFGGDALLIFFEGSLGPLQATTAAHAMQEAMAAYSQVETSQGTFPLRMKIGIGSGLILLTSLGSERERNYAVMGNALGEMSRAEESATAGQILVDQATRDATVDAATFAKAGEELWRLVELSEPAQPEVHSELQSEATYESADEFEADPERKLSAELQLVEALNAYIPNELVQRLVADPQRPMAFGSHRPVSVMFANFTGIDAIAVQLASQHLEDVTSILNAYFVRMSSIIGEHGGTVSRVDNYLTGQRILGLFGALQAHEDDPQRAVAAGLQMNQSVAEVNREVVEILSHLLPTGLQIGERPIQQRIGINSGFVFAGDVGGGLRREFTVMGDHVNLTARIMSVAQYGTVRLGENTERQVAREVELEPQAAVQVKGKTAPIQTFEAQGLRIAASLSGSRPTTPIVGRDTELRTIAGKAELAHRGQGQIVLIQGEAGLGKSRLVDEAVQLEQERGFTHYRGEARSYGGQSTYLAWDGVWRGMLGVDSSNSSEAQIAFLEQIISTIDPDLVPRLPLLGPLLNLPIPDSDLTRHFDAKLRKTLLERLLADLLRFRAREQALLILLEDTHWLDPLSVDLLQVLGETIADLPVLMLLAGRSGGDDGLVEIPDARFPHQTRIELGPLEADHAEQWITLKIGQLYGADVSPPDAFVERLVTRSEGNPFYIEEVLNSLKDNAISPQDDEALSALELPASLHSLVLSRIDELTERPRKSLRVASVVGRSFEARHITGASPDLNGSRGIEAELVELNRKGFIQPVARSAAAYLFRQGVIQEVAYESLSYGLRRNLHVTFAEFMERAHAGELEGQTDLLAHHFFSGEAWPKALQYKVQSALKAQKAFGNQSAIRAAREALHAADHLEPDSETHRGALMAHEVIGEVLGWQALYSDSVEAFQSMLHVAEQLDDAEAQARAWHGMAESQMHQGDLHGAIKSAEEEDQVATRNNLDLASARARRMQGWGAFRLGEIDQALELTDGLVELSSALEDKGERAENMNLIGVLNWASGDYAAAEQYFKHALETFESIGDVRRAMPLANNLAVIAESRGDYAAAAKGYNEALRIAREIGNRDGEMVYLGNLGGVKVLQGDAVGAEADLRAVLDMADPEGMDVLADTLSLLAEASLSQGKVDEAFELSSQALKKAVSVESRDDLGAVWRVLGMVIAEMREPPELEHSPLGPNSICDAGICFLESDRIFREIGREDELARTLRAWAMHEHRLGHQQQAEIKWEEAKGLFEKIGATHEVARMKERPGDAAHPTQGSGGHPD